MKKKMIKIIVFLVDDNGVGNQFHGEITASSLKGISPNNSSVESITFKKIKKS